MPFSASVENATILVELIKQHEGTRADDTLQGPESRNNLHVKHEEEMLSHSHNYS